MKRTSAAGGTSRPLASSHFRTPATVAALHNRRHAMAHPNAHMRQPMTLESCRATQMTAAPLRLLSNVADCPAEAVTMGAAVQVAFHETTTPELGLPVFTLANTSSSGPPAPSAR